MNLSEVGGLDLGCIIDGSHDSGTELDIAIIEMALDFGYDLGTDEWESAKKSWHDRGDLAEWDFIDLCENIRDEASMALDWMNEQLPEGYFFGIDNNCLYLELEDERV